MSTSHGESLRTQPPPRSPELVARIVAKYAPWWGFAFYGLLYLALAATLGAGLVAALLDAILSGKPSLEILSHWIIGEAIAIPIGVYLLVRWIARRRRGFRALAERGAVQPVYIESIGTTVLFASIIGARNTGIVIWVRHAGTSYRAMVRGTRMWATPGTPGIIAIPDVSYALFLGPDDEDLLARESSP